VDDIMLQKIARHAQQVFEKHHPEMIAAAGEAPAKPVKPAPGEPAPRPAASRESFGAGAAGVSLYAVAAHIGALHANVQTNRTLGDTARGILTSPEATEEQKAEAKQVVQRHEESEKVLAAAASITAKKITDQRFMSGFGSDGGEEYLSFLLIGDVLHGIGGKDWKTWNRLVSDRLTRTQNRDGSWSGHHCIMGQTICTAAAVMTLLTDRQPGSMSLASGR
jgi:hypothetical protein